MPSTRFVDEQTLRKRISNQIAFQYERRLHMPQRYAHGMRRFNSPSLLASSITRALGHTRSAASILLSDVRLGLGATLKYGWGRCGSESRSITLFAKDFGLEYVNASVKGGEEVCNFRLPR